MATQSKRRDAAKESARSARLEARVTEKQKDLFMQAAALQGRSLTDFLVASAQEAAAKTVREHEVVTLSGRDRELFVSALLNPPAPGNRLREAARRYKAISRGE